MKRHLYSTSFYRKLTFLFRTGWTNVIRRQFGWIFFLYLLLLWVMRCLLLLLVARGGKSAVDWALFLWNASVVSTLCGQKIFRALMLRAHNQMKAGKKKDVTKGSFNNYVDRILPFFDPPPLLCGRTLPDITSGLEVWQIFKVRTVRKPDVFHPGHQTLKIIKKSFKDFFCFTFDPKSVSRDLILW